MIHFICLAAGYSVRFGSNKLLHAIDGKPMYRHVTDQLLEIRRDGKVPCDITVVTQYEEILEDLKGSGILTVVNPDPSRGISSSVQTGIEALPADSAENPEDFLVFINADQPFLRKETLVSFVRSAEKSGRKLAALSFKGEMMSPCMFHTSYIPALMKLKGDKGGKSILRSNAGEVFLFEPAQKEELVDIDTLC